MVEVLPNMIKDSVLFTIYQRNQGVYVSRVNNLDLIKVVLDNIVVGYIVTI